MPASLRKTKYKKLNITLPEDIILTLKKTIGEKQVSNFISEAVKSKFKEFKKNKLKAELIEGYKATSKEDMKLHEDFEGTLMDGLDKD